MLLKLKNVEQATDQDLLELRIHTMAYSLNSQFNNNYQKKLT